MRIRTIKYLGLVLAFATSLTTTTNAQLILTASGSGAIFSSSSGGVASPLSDGGTSVVSVSAQPYSFGSGDTGTLATSVYSGDGYNPLGGYTYVYTLTISGGVIATAELNGDWGSSVYLGYGKSSTSIPYGGALSSPSLVNLFGGNPGVGGTLGVGTYYFLVGTSSTQVGLSTASLIDGGSQSGISIAVPVPEPTTMIAGAMLLVPFGMSTLRSLRNRGQA
jgi:hypothetical protein